VKQADEDIEDGQIEAIGGKDVVCLTTVNHATGIEQDKSAHQQNDCSRHGQRQTWDIQEHIGDHGQYNDHHTRKQEATHKAEITLGGEGIARKTQEDDASATKGSTNNLRPVRQGKVL